MKKIVKKALRCIKQCLSVVLVLTICMFSSIDVYAAQSRTENFDKTYSISGNQADDLISVAEKQIGKKESELGYTEAWCADFVCDCAKLTGMSDNIIPYNYGSRARCDYLYKYMKEKCSATPVTERKKGDIVFYYCSACKRYVHTGIVLDETYSIEGNYGDQVTKVKSAYRDKPGHTLASGTITRKYLRPNYRGKKIDPVTTAPSIWKNRDNYVVGDSVKFSWNSVENATGYWLTVWYKGEQIVTTQVSGNSEYTLENLGEGEYTAFLSAYNEVNNMESSITLKVIAIPQGTQTISDGEYHIISALDSSKALDVAWGSKENGANIQLYDNLENGDQTFYVTYLGNGAYKIVNSNSGRCLDVDAAGMEAGTNVQQYDYAGADQQQWIILENDGWFSIVSKKNGLYLDVQGGDSSNEANVQVWNKNGSDAQKWRFIAWGNADGQTIKDDEYHIVSALDEKQGLDVQDCSKENGANIQIYPNTWDSRETFRVNYLGQGYYKIINTYSGKGLDAAGAEVKSGTNLQQYDYVGVNQQQWILRKTSDGYYKIISKASGLCVDIENGTAANNVNVRLWIDNDTKAQKWRFVQAKKEISECSVQLAEDKCVYDGKEKIPNVVVKDGDTVLTKDTDYTISYKNNLNAGKATITITGTGKYTGKTTKEFEIAKATQEVRVSPNEISISVGEIVQIEATGQGQISYKSDAEEKVTVSNTGKVTGKQAGKATITITASGNENYNSASKILTVNVKAENVVKEGWKKDSKGWWYQNKDGSYPKSQWKKIGTKWYHFDKNGYMETGWLLVNGSWYYLNSDGTMQTDWLLEKGIWYHLNSDGKMETGLVTVGNAKYYLNKSGKMQTGWQNLSGTWYYFKADGKMAVNGWQEVGGKWYYLDQNGAMQKSKWISGIYYVKADGSMAVSEWVDQDRYYVDANGKWVKDKVKEA